MNVYEVVLKTFTTVTVEATGPNEARQAALDALDTDPEVMYAFSDNAEVTDITLVEENIGITEEEAK